MTREEHIARLEIIKNYLCAKKDIESMTYAIETLMQEPKFFYDKGYTDGMKAYAYHMELCKEEQEPCEDCISREQAIRLFERRFIELQKVHQQDKQLGINWCINTIKDMPSIQPSAEQEPRIDFEELKRKILMEVDGGTDDAWLAYGEVCNRISNSIDEFVADMRKVEQ